MEETIERLREYVDNLKLIDGEEGRHYKIIRLLANTVLIMHDQGYDLPTKTLAELEKHL